MSKIYVLSLGCDKNRVDTENALFNLINAGHEITNNPSEADIALINTCSFISSAEKESIDSIFEMNCYRKNKLKKIIVTGCLTERYKDSLLEMLPEVDIFFGCRDYSKIAEAVDGDKKYYCDNSDKPTVNRTLSTPEHYAYLKISDGCDNFCTYCTIPSIRGKYVSRTLESLVAECKALSAYSLNELILVAQDVTNYGKDIYGVPSLINLLENILNNTKDLKLRLLYCYPELVTDELISFVAGNDRIYNYLDIPLQHVSNNVLKRMGRKSTKKEIIDLFNKLSDNNIVVRTTFMVGFPGETEEDFNELCEFVKKYKPLRAGIFKYSRERGTPAYKMDNQISQIIKNDRYRRLSAVINENIIEFNRSLVGKVIDVVYDDIDYDKQMFIGRTPWDAPEIDCKVYFTSDFCDVGKIYKVKIKGYKKFDLFGEVV